MADIVIDADTKNLKTAEDWEQYINNATLPEWADVNLLDDTERDYEKYQVAFDNADVGLMEALRKKHPEDARFNLHLKYAKMNGANDKNFKDILGLHKEINDNMGIAEVPEFNKLVESGNKEKAIQFVKELPNDHPLKDAMKQLLEFI